MVSQVITTYEHSQFKLLLAECIAETLQNEIAKILIQIPPSEQILTRHETAKLLKISLPTLHTYTLSGVIKAHRIGHKVRYLLSDVHEALKVINKERRHNGY